MKVVFYSNASGKSPVLENINELGKEDQARLFGCLKNIEELGFSMLRSKKIYWFCFTHSKNNLRKLRSK